MCVVNINVLLLFLMVSWFGLQYVIVVFPDHTHLLFFCWNQNIVHMKILDTNAYDDRKKIKVQGVKDV